MDDESAAAGASGDVNVRHSANLRPQPTAPVSMPHAHATSDAQHVHKSAIGPLKITHAIGAARVTHAKKPLKHSGNVHIDAHKPKAWPRPTNEAMFVKEAWVARSESSGDDATQPVEARLPPIAIATKPAKKNLDVQVVIDYVGHGVASDPPVLTPQLAPLEDSLTSVQSSEFAARYEWKHEETAELAIVGAVVLAVAMVVIVFTRRQQRAFEEQQLALEASAQELEGDLENGATAGSTGEDETVCTAESAADPTVELSAEKEDHGDAIKSPDSVVEGCV